MPPQIPRDDLILELLLDGNADDTSGGGRHGVVHGAVPTPDRFGRRDGAYLFRGHDHIMVSPPPALSAVEGPLSGRAFSLSVWARVDTSRMQGWSQCFVCQDNGDDVDQSRRIFQLSVFNGHVVWHRMQGAADPTSRQFVVPGAWFHVAAVVDNDIHRLYIDGALQDSVRHPWRVHADEPLYIGRKGTDEPCFFVQGALDEVRLFNRALTASEIRALANDAGAANPETRWNAPPISGLWGLGDEGLLDLRFDGRSQVRGAIIAGQRGHIAAIALGTFDAGSGRLTLGGRATRPDTGAEIAYEIEGVLARRRLNVRYRFGEQEGQETVRKVGEWRALRRAWRSVGRKVERFLAPAVRPLIRWHRARLRPTKAENMRRLAARGETISELVFRDATLDDIPALSELHAKTWAATYPHVRRPPTAALREHQWREAFGSADGSWFCFVIENRAGQLIGFAKGVRTGEGRGDLNKIYLLSEYQRMGIGRRLIGHVARRFLQDGVSTMTLSADPGNPSCRFYEALGAEHQRDADGRESDSAFIWKDLDALAKVCPAPARFTTR